MKTKFTPGPWHVGMKPGPMIYGPNGEQVADMRAQTLEDSEHAANVFAIAALPDLVAALEGLFEHCTMIHKHWGDGCNAKQSEAAIAVARAALAKVKGE